MLWKMGGAYERKMFWLCLKTKEKMERDRKTYFPNREMDTDIYIYIYIERERERERQELYNNLN